MNDDELQALQHQVDDLAMTLGKLDADERRQWVVGLLTRIDHQLDGGRPFERWLLGLADVLRERAAFGQWPRKWAGSSSSASSSTPATADDQDQDDDQD
jgi:hypothetical protein